MEISVISAIEALQEPFSGEVMIVMYSPIIPPLRIYTEV